MNIDANFLTFFNGNIRQVFIYATNRCQLNCEQCLYKTQIDNNSNDIPFETIANLLKAFREMGAFKISFLGGEPTLYSHDSYSFPDLVCLSKQIGYSYIRVDTNGQFSSSYLEEKNLKMLDEITFSLDGYSEFLNDIVRGKGTYRNCVDNIQNAVRLGYNVQITSCVHNSFCPNYSEGIKNIKEMILFSESLGVKSINFHPILKVGVPRDEWINDTDIEPETWMAIYNDIIPWIQEQAKIHVRVPMRFVSLENYSKNKEKYDYCPIRLKERILILPNGELKICAFNIGCSKSIGTYTSDSINYLYGTNNEIESPFNSEGKCCSNQLINNQNLIPLCMSYKPNQHEPVWDKCIGK